ncbi:hypothetical protein STAS_08530 [Striga asiatica]|uniref:25S rRNA (uridine-N(3))-methyltransferase BMT5-like domain-containing protein n=1 Tax=Striga asiatica TaxID=4170 RepID=A0A5A7PII5_STRAF|nr:hypothetical protein STAS_08530 [Striga asiatica]
MGILVSVIRYYLGSDITDDNKINCAEPLKTTIRDDDGNSNSNNNKMVKSPENGSNNNNNNNHNKGIIRRFRHYSNGQQMLLVGEGDFSFSTCLARSFGLAPNIIATSLNSEVSIHPIIDFTVCAYEEEFLVKNYECALRNIVELGIRKCKVMHEIDATLIANHEFLGAIKFDRIIFNFPFAGFFGSMPLDSQLRRHRRLVSLFLKNAKEMLSEKGEIHISHKTNGVHAEWKLESMASSHGLMLVEAVDFKLHHYPGYNTKRGFGGDENFNCYPSKTYKFRLKC